jgi:aminocarboxymuconate-semialdehyde decarboxylase
VADEGGDVAADLIDFHTHAIAPRLPDLERVAPWGRWPSVEQTAADTARINVGDRAYRAIDDRCWSAERRIADMDVSGVAVQVLSPVPVTFCHDAPAEGALLLARSQNDFLAGLTAQGRDRLRALGAVPLQDPVEAAGELRRCVTELGFIGVEIGTRVGDRELGDPLFDSFFDAAADLGAVIFVHPADTTLDPRLAALGVAFGAACRPRPGSRRPACSSAVRCADAARACGCAWRTAAGRCPGCCPGWTGASGSKTRAFRRPSCPAPWRGPCTATR